MEKDATQSIRLIACPHLLSIEKDRIDVELPVGGTITDIMRSISWHPTGMVARVLLDGKLVKDAEWEYTVPSPGQSLVMRAFPMGGDGGQGKDAMRIGLMIAVIAASIYTGGVAGAAFGAFYGAAASAAVSIVGTLTINGCIPPPRPRRSLPRPLEDQREAA